MSTVRLEDEKMKNGKVPEFGGNELKKLMLLAGMLAMVLVAAAPAFGQAVAIDEGDDVEYNAVCQNIIGSFGDITQTQDGDADAVAVDDSAAAAEVAQEQGVSIEQVNECLNNFATASATATATATPSATVVAKKKVVVVAGKKVTVTASATSSATSTATSTATTTALPETGGLAAPGAIALGAGVLLVAGGLVARRIVR
jgi:LPXTG-motif cell wall-anchored protein